MHLLNLLKCGATDTTIYIFNEPLMNFIEGNRSPRPLAGLIRTVAVKLQPFWRFVEKTFIWKVNKTNIAQYGEKPEAISPTKLEEIDRKLMALDSNATKWRNMPREEKASLFRKCVQLFIQYGEDIAILSTRHKGSYGQGIGEEYLCLVPIVTYLSEVAECFEKRAYPNPYSTRRSSDGTQWIVDVCPVGMSALALGGFKGELYINPGHDVSQGGSLDKAEKETEPGVGLVLGAGNQYPLAVLDILHVLVMQSRVVVCKMNPVNEYMGPLLCKGLSPLIEAGFVDFVYGASKEGKYLVDHPVIQCIHLTGSTNTFDAIVWGSNTAKDGEPPCKKEVCAELGCVTPYIVVPGNWTEEQIEYHAMNVVSGLVNNAGHNCLAAEVVVTDRNWAQRETFLDAIRRNLDLAYCRTSYYPGSDDNYKMFEKMFPDCENHGREASQPVGVENGSHHPWKFQVGLTPDTCKVSEENWCGVLQEVSLDSDSIEDYLKNAETFVNEQCWGTLSCSILIDDSITSEHEAAWENFISGLKYGSICVNIPGMVGFGLTKLTWGAWGDDSQDVRRNIGSGNTKVHNSGFFDNVQKSVLYAPCSFSPTPYWFVSNTNLDDIAAAAVKFFSNMGILSMARLVQTALRG